jgi:transcriptional regulator with XRE-family HTH domain
MLMDAKTESPEPLPHSAVVIREARIRRGFSQEELAKKVGTTQQTIGKIETGKIKGKSFFPRLSLELGVSLPEIDPSLPKNAFGGVIPGDQLAGDKDLPVHAAAAGGKGAIIVSTDPVEWVARPQPLLRVKDGYGIIVIETSMSPEFEPGDTALVHPHLPPTIGSTCVFYTERQDGTVEAVIKRLRRFTADSWYVEQFSPKRSFTLKRAEWQKCHVTVGRYIRR